MEVCAADIYGLSFHHDRLISELLNDVLFQCITEIASEHRFIPSAW
jgi:hypothetical protein